MEKSTYAIGVDFGTLSARASVVSVQDGHTLSTAERPYHVYDQSLPSGAPVPPNGALADPREYHQALIEAVKEAAALSGAAPEQICGIAVDATSASVVAADDAGTPMCMKPEWETEPHAYIKLWKSHSAQKEALLIAEKAVRERAPFLDTCGGRPSSEWIYPKMLETLRCRPGLYHAAAYYLDLCDYLTWYLCGRLTRNVGALGFKTFYSHLSGLPKERFLKDLDPAFGDANQKLSGPAAIWGERTGGLKPDLAKAMGLQPGIAVACGSLDGHVSMTALGLTQDGDCMITIGTSGVTALISSRFVPVPGICGAAMDGLIPGFFGYDAGQSCIGDMLAWFVDNCVPAAYFKKAREAGLSAHTLLSRMGLDRAPSPHDPVALDWWNGNRCTIGDMSLTGVIAGLTLKTLPEDLYRALVTSTAFGLKRILENYEAHGVPVKRIRACGGIATKNPLLVQCYSDVLNRPLEVSALPNSAATGAAITAAAAAGRQNGGYDTLAEAIAAMRTGSFLSYRPNPAYVPGYERQYTTYCRMYDSHEIFQ